MSQTENQDPFVQSSINAYHVMCNRIVTERYERSGKNAELDKTLSDLNDQATRLEGEIQGCAAQLEAPKPTGASSKAHAAHRERAIQRMAEAEEELKDLRETDIPAAEQAVADAHITPEQECNALACEMGVPFDAARAILGAVLTASNHTAILTAVGKQALGQQGNAAAGALIIDGYLRNLEDEYRTALEGAKPDGADRIENLELRYIAYRMCEHVGRYPSNSFYIDYRPAGFVVENLERKVEAYRTPGRGFEVRFAGTKEYLDDAKKVERFVHSYLQGKDDACEELLK